MSFNVYITNHLFNNDFFIPEATGNFPAGWQKHMIGRNSSIDWEKNDKTCSIKIKNRSRQMISICQRRAFSVPVDKGQIWKAAAKFKAEREIHATIIVHFIAPSSRLLNTVLDFIIDVDNCYYSGILSIPTGAEYAFFEIGLKEPGIIWIEEVEFIKVFPVGEYNTDNRGRLNINTVENVKHILEPVVAQSIVEPINVKHIIAPVAVQSIIEPVKVQGTFKPVKLSVDFREDVVAGSVYGSSKVQDVLLLTIYSFCVMNLGTYSVMVRLQISPDGVHWIDEPGSDNSIRPGENKILISSYFLRYIRVAFIAEHGGNSNVSIFFQGNG